MPATFLTANVYVNNKSTAADAALLARIRPDVAGLQEAMKWHPRLRNMAGYRLVGAAGAAGTRGSAEVPLLIRPADAWRGEGLQRMSRDMGTPIAPDRWACWARLVLPGLGRVLAVNTHANAAIVGHDGRPLEAPRVDEYIKHMRRLSELIAYHRAAGWPPVVMLDANVPASSDWRWAPAQLFDGMGLDYVAHRIDGIAWDRRAFDLLGKQLHNPHGADHVWLEATLQRQEGTNAGR